jgi:hypothetical protein
MAGQNHRIQILSAPIILSKMILSFRKPVLDGRAQAGLVIPSRAGMLGIVSGKWQKLLPVVFMLLAALSRWPGLFPPNFSAFYGLAFCAGVFFPRFMAWWLPLVTLIVTDALLNIFYYKAPVFSVYMLITLVSLALLILLGRRFSRRTPLLGLLSGGLLGAVLFYLITNTASWLYNPDYPKTFAGWLQALSNGLPGYPPTWTFFRNTLLSGGLFTGLFAGAMKLTEAAEPATEDEETPAPAAVPEEAPEEAKA